MLKFAKVTLLVASLCLLAAGVFAQAPGTLTYQGKLTDNALDAVDYAVDVTFSIYASEDVEEVPLWTEVHVGLTPNELGIFTVELGALEPFPLGLFDGSVRYLGITVGTDDEMAPRQKITSAPYAMKADVPGFASAYHAGVVYLATSPTTISSLEVMVPGPGYVVVDYTAYYGTYHINTEYSYLYVWVDSLPDQSLTHPYWREYISYYAVTGDYSGTVATNKVLVADTAGLYTFYARGYKSGIVNSAYVDNGTLKAVYYPAYLGTGSPLPAAVMSTDVTEPEAPIETSPGQQGIEKQ